MSAVKKKVPNRSYTEEFKQKAVHLSASVGCSAAAKRLEIPEANLWHWCSVRGRKGLTRVSKAIRRPTSELEAELKRLWQANASLKLDNEILKNRPRGLRPAHMDRNPEWV